MKEFKKLDKLINKQQVESIVKKQKEDEFKFDGTLKPKKGHTVYEINNKTLEVNIASYVKTKSISWKDALIGFNTGNYKKEIVIKKGFSYISALSKKSALERFKKNKGSSVIPKGLLKL